MSWSGYIPGDLIREEPARCFNPDCRHPAIEHDPESGCSHSYTSGESRTKKAVVCECDTLEYPPGDD